MGDYDLTLGTLLIGIFFNTYLFGVVTYQFAAYWRTPFGDRIYIKLMVFFLFLVDVVHSAAVLYMAWYYCVTNFTNPAALATALWPYTFTPIATALAAFMTHAFLGYRVYVLLHNNKIIYGILLTAAFVSMILGLYSGSKAWTIRVLSEVVVLTPIVTAWLSLQAGLDLILTLLLIWCFWKSRTGFEKTDTILNTLIRGAVQTGVFAAIFALGDLATFIQYPNANYYGMFAIPLGRIYTNTLMDTLLTRETLRGKFGSGDNNVLSTGPHSELRWGRTGTVDAEFQLDERTAASAPEDSSTVKPIGLGRTPSLSSEHEIDHKLPSMA